MEYRFTQQREQTDTVQLTLWPTAKHKDFRMAAPRLALAVFVLMLAVITVTEGKIELDNDIFKWWVREVKELTSQPLNSFVLFALEKN